MSSCSGLSGWAEEGNRSSKTPAVGKINCNTDTAAVLTAGLNLQLVQTIIASLSISTLEPSRLIAGDALRSDHSCSFDLKLTFCVKQNLQTAVFISSFLFFILLSHCWEPKHHIYWSFCVLVRSPVHEGIKMWLQMFLPVSVSPLWASVPAASSSSSSSSSSTAILRPIGILSASLRQAHLSSALS